MTQRTHPESTTRENLLWGIRRVLAASIPFAVLGSIPFAYFAADVAKQWGISPLRLVVGYAAPLIPMGLLIGGVRPHLRRRGVAMLVGVVSAWLLLTSLGLCVAWQRTERSLWLIPLFTLPVAPLVGALIGLETWKMHREGEL